MKAVIVRYKVQSDYIEQNKQNIQRVEAALLTSPIEGMMYSAYNLEDDPQSFVHINISREGETMSKLNEVPEFQAFRKGLKASNPISPPNAIKLVNVASGFVL